MSTHQPGFTGARKLSAYEPLFRGVCSCGWESQGLRSAETQAYKDATQHADTLNAQETPVTIKPAPPENPTDTDLRAVQVELAKALVAMEWRTGYLSDQVIRSNSESKCDAVYFTETGFEILFYSAPTTRMVTKCVIVAPDKSVVTIKYGFAPWEILAQRHFEIEAVQEEHRQQISRNAEYSATSKFLDMIRGDR